MKKLSAFLVACMVVAPVWSNPAPATGRFERELPGSDDTVVVTSATFDDDICFKVTGFASDGEHISEIVVYDGSGREVARVIYPVTAKRARWAGGFCYRFRADRDVPGTWWYVASLDDLPAVSESIPISYGKPVKQSSVGR